MWWLLHCRQRWSLQTSCQHTQLEQILTKEVLTRIHTVANRYVCAQHCNTVSVLCAIQAADKNLQKIKRLVQKSAISRKVFMALKVCLQVREYTTEKMPVLQWA